MKKIVIAGGTGFIGTYLTMCFEELGYEVLIVSRSVDAVSWSLVELIPALEGADLVINLAGKSINCRHTDKNKQAIIDSRISSTQLIGNAISACKNPPRLWINASATGIYKPSLSHLSIETDSESATDFLAEVVTKWETAFFDFKLPATRQIALRTSVVLGATGGALPTLSRLASVGLGGKQADGHQLFSWIHLDDYFRIIQFAISNEDLCGIVNCTAPSPVSNSDLMREIRHAVNVRIGLPAPRCAINVGAKIMGTEPELILASSNVVPKRLNDAGYVFKFPTIQQALANLLPI